jgi:FAD/FMN-containing dehydrogenase
LRSDGRVEVEDASGFRGWADAVFRPADEAELTSLLRRAHAEEVPVTISGAGTGVAGGRVPQGGWLLEMSRFEHLEIHNGAASAGAAVSLRALHQAATASAQLYGPDPTEISASFGGTIATNASGSRSFRYGDTRRAVQALRVVLADGTLLSLRRGEPVPFPVTEVRQPATTKNATAFPLRPGMDYLDLFIGSEGTLGVVTGATVELHPLAGDRLNGVVFFASDDAALDAVDGWRSAARLNMLEYLDEGSLQLLRARRPDIPANAAAALLIEADLAGEDDLDQWDARMTASGALTELSWFGTSPAERERFRAFRHALPEAVNETVRRRGLLKAGTDFAVPLQRNREILRVYRDTLDGEFPGQYVIFGHIGDAHVHVNILPSGEAEASRAQELITGFAKVVVAMGGTVAAEHGLGKRKAHLLSIMYRPDELAAFRAVKKRLDPKGLLGRGTLL